MAPIENTRIYIDSEPIDVKERRLNGVQLRTLIAPSPENLWLDVADAQDYPIAPTETVAIEPGMRFFTDRPRTIYIDKAPYEVRTAVLTETQLRALPTPAIPDDHGIWKDIPDDLDDPIDTGELVTIISGDRFFTNPLPKKEIRVTVNRRPVVLDGVRQTGASIKKSAIDQGVPIQIDFLLARKNGPKFKPVGDDEHIRVRNDDEFRANDGDDNS
ncbi:multiubiquitin domain-containing protein [Rhodococcus koreensis]|uniref:Multiubiquitin n=1 Tax=Rhodococcus koreensis TaxID=99653 RepID=A0A1H4KSN2_9NOCA|nr:multiubiquitin domain-containing protein [Rhodococcus koreensis]SEB61108.1 Multiubiquitin [Rhodococcus koreensis]